MKHTIALSIGLFALAAGGAFALTGQEILERAEEAASPDTEIRATETMTLVAARGSRETRRFEIYQAGTEQLLMRFLSPADIRGVAVLVDSQGTRQDLIYLYMPAFRRERRIASHIKNEEFMGTGLTYEDMAELDYSERYRVQNWSESSGVYTLTLEPKHDDVSYSRAVMTVDRESFLPLRTELYRGDRLVKTIENEEIVRHQGYWVPMKMTVENRESGQTTIIEVESITHEADPSESLFTVRSLRRFR